MKDDSGEGGEVGALDGGFCRIRRSPDTPTPCSCSGRIGDLAIPSNSVGFPPSMENRILLEDGGMLIGRFPVLRVFGMASCGAGELDGWSCSESVGYGAWRRQCVT